MIHIISRRADFNKIYTNQYLEIPFDQAKNNYSLFGKVVLR